MDIAIVTDEISLDPATAIELGQEWGIRHFELRSVASGRLPYVSDGDRRRLIGLSKQEGVTFTVLSPGFFKSPLDSDETARQFDDGVPRAVELAHDLGISKMIFFGGLKDATPRADAFPRAAELLAKCADKLQEAGILLLLENEHVCWADTGSHAVEVLKLAGHPNIRLNWDPCNCFWVGTTPYPDEYAIVKSHIGHLHLKDTARDANGNFRGVPIGEGDVGWREQLTALLRDGWRGPFTVETHYAPKVRGSRDCVRNLRRLLLELV